jgi:hypothetical protein
MKRVPSSPSSWIAWSICMTATFAPPCSGPGEGADARRDRREEVGGARAHHPHGRGGAVLLVVGVQEEQQVERRATSGSATYSLYGSENIMCRKLSQNGSSCFGKT